MLNLKPLQHGTCATLSLALSIPSTIQPARLYAAPLSVLHMGIPTDRDSGANYSNYPEMSYLQQ